MFRALLLKDPSLQKNTDVLHPVTLSSVDFPDRDIVVDVHYSTLNYKDALAIVGKGGIVRDFPMVPGIDLAGTVCKSRDPAFSPGERVIANGWGLGERHWGGLSQRASLDGRWLQHCPDKLSLKDAMALGTAGYTAMLCLMALQRNGLKPSSGRIAVTGASGGVGSVAVALLHAMGFAVDAVTGSTDHHDYLKALGADGIIARDGFSTPGKPLQSAQYAGGIDTAGSHTLANLCARVAYGGTVAACGLAQGPDLPASVMPFILRGVTLAGIDSVMRPAADRKAAWQQLAEMMPREALAQIAPDTLTLDEVPSAAAALMAGTHCGRVVVDLQA